MTAIPYHEKMTQPATFAHPGPKAGEGSRVAGSLRHCVHRIAEALLDTGTLGGILGAPVLSIAGCIGLFQPPTTLLHGIGSGLVIAGLLLFVLAITLAHVTVGLRRVP